MQTEIHELKGLAATEALGASLAAHLKPGDIVALEGELGTGKTTLVRAVASALGADPRQVSSPTFVSMQEYRCEGSGAIASIIHIDAYRMRSERDLQTIGWDEQLLRPDVVILIEWPSKVVAALPLRRLEVQLEHRPESCRRAVILDHRAEDGRSSSEPRNPLTTD